MTKDNGHFHVNRCLRPTPIPIRRYQAGTLSLIGTIATVVVATGSVPAQAAVLTAWRFDPAANQLEVTLQEQITPQYFVLGQPPRIVLDLPNTQVGKATQQNYSGAVRKIRVSQFQPDVTRIVLELSPEVVLAIGQMQLEASGKGGWLLRLGIAGQSTPNPTITLPSDNGSSQQVVVTNVPPLAQAVNPVTSTTLPPATVGSQQPASVSVPPLTSPPRVDPGATPASEPYSKPVINFGQPLPEVTPGATTPQTLPVLQPTPVLPEVTSSNSTGATPSVVVPSLNSTSAVETSAKPSSQPDILLPAGTQLNLRYAGKPLTLKAGSPQPAELLLQSDLRSPDGNLIAAVGTSVIGRFETNSDGSRFIAQEIAVQNRNLTIAAQSELLSNQTSKSPTLEPGQILQIRLTENLPKF